MNARAPVVPAEGVLMLVGAVVLLGAAWPITRYAVVAGASPLWFAEARAVLSGVSALALVAPMRRLCLPVRADLPALLAIGVLQLGGFFALVHLAVAWVPAGRTAILCNTTTIFVLPLSLVVLREPIGARRWLAVLGGLGGILVLMNPWSIDWTAPGVLLGHTFLLAAAAAWGVTIIVVRRFPPRHSMLQLLPWCFAIATVMLLPMALEDGTGPVWPIGALVAIGYVGLVGGPIGTWCVMQAAMTLPALVASLGFLMGPAVGLLLATVWLHEPLTADLLVGALMILGSVAFAAWPGARA